MQEDKCCFYQKLDKAKDGTLIPFFFNEKPMFSLYNPHRDFDIFCKSFIEIKEPTCVFIGGIGTGFHINKIIENKNITLIFALEADNLSLNLSQENIKESEKIIFCTISDFKSKILENYIPQIHGGFFFNCIKSWELAFHKFYNLEENYLKDEILEILNMVSRDIATQSHFGKIWHKNILHNIYHFFQCVKQNKIASNKDFNINKIGAIIGASPILDIEYRELIQNRHRYFIFATDTSFQVLIGHNIIPDAIVTLDGQNQSTKHFITSIDFKPILISDFCANPSIIKKFVKNNCKVAFTNSGHPLSQLFEIWLYNNKIPNCIYNVSAGNGTVLQLALDFAFSIGFKDFKLFGAEFAYSNYKAYCKGTYFDYLHNTSSNKIDSTENKYSKLFYRSKLIASSKGPTTENLLAYKNYLDKYLTTKIYSKNEILSPKINLNENDFFLWYINNLEKKEKNSKKTLFPLLAWINNSNKKTDNENEALYITKNLISGFLLEE